MQPKFSEAAKDLLTKLLKRNVSVTQLPDPNSSTAEGKTRVP